MMRSKEDVREQLIAAKDLRSKLRDPESNIYRTYHDTGYDIYLDGVEDTLHWMLGELGKLVVETGKREEQTKLSDIGKEEEKQ